MADYVRCSRCGKRVSNEVPDDLIVRAWVECPECVERNTPTVSDCARCGAESSAIGKPDDLAVCERCAVAIGRAWGAAEAQDRTNTPHPTPWRQGRKVPRNVYDAHDAPIVMAPDDTTAARIVAAVNTTDTRPAAPLTDERLRLLATGDPTAWQRLRDYWVTGKGSTKPRWPDTGDAPQ